MHPGLPILESSKAGRCFDNPERSDSRIVDNSVLSGGSGLKETTGGPRSGQQGSAAMCCNWSQVPPHVPTSSYEANSDGREGSSVAALATLLLP